MILILIS